MLLLSICNRCRHRNSKSQPVNQGSGFRVAGFSEPRGTFRRWPPGLRRSPRPECCRHGDLECLAISARLHAEGGLQGWGLGLMVILCVCTCFVCVYIYKQIYIYIYIYILVYIYVVYG